MTLAPAAESELPAGMLRDGGVVAGLGVAIGELVVRVQHPATDRVVEHLRDGRVVEEAIFHRLER